MMSHERSSGLFVFFLLSNVYIDIPPLACFRRISSRGVSIYTRLSSTTLELYKFRLPRKIPALPFPFLSDSHLFPKPAPGSSSTRADDRACALPSPYM